MTGICIGNMYNKREIQVYTAFV